MKSLNFVEIETKTGEKAFELIQADITALPFAVDLMVVSAFNECYAPTPSSIIGQFHQKNLSVEQLAKNPQLDLRDSMGVWVSHPVGGFHFRHLVCVEIIGTNQTFEEAIKNLFATLSVLEIQGHQFQSIAIPVIGAGNQGIAAEKIIPAIIRTSMDFLEYSRYLNKVYFVVYQEAQAEFFSEAMNEFLGRQTFNGHSGGLADFLIQDLNKLLSNLELPQRNHAVFREFKEAINSDFRLYQFGATARKVLEFIISDVHPHTYKGADLEQRIDSFHSAAKWIRSYFHVIRLISNRDLHYYNQINYFPEYVEEKDLEIGLYCMVRILQFYIDFKNIKKAKKTAPPPQY